jgi:hypothetical protein
VYQKGIVGVVTKPVVGIFDLASNVTEGISFQDDLRNADLNAMKIRNQKHYNRFLIKIIGSTKTTIYLLEGMGF